MSERVSFGRNEKSFDSSGKLGIGTNLYRLTTTLRAPLFKLTIDLGCPYPSSQVGALSSVAADSSLDAAVVLYVGWWSNMAVLGVSMRV